MVYTPLELAVLIKVEPSPEELTQAKKIVGDLSNAARIRARKFGVHVEPLLVGSLAKGTFLRDVDIDLFLLFDPNVSREKLQKYGLALGHALVPNGEERYAEHPYVHGWVEGHEIDVVPCYKVESTQDKMSAVDRTPFHTIYITKHLDEKKKRDVLLLKQFMKGTRTYGAEASVGGFSGYLAELMVLKYGSFQGVLEGAREWKKGMVLTVSEPPGKRFPEPLVFVDPVDNKRNVAAALTKEVIELFQDAAYDYLNNPASEFFFPNKPERTNAKEAKEIFDGRGTFPLLLRGNKPDMVDDVFYPQFLKMNKTIVNRCKDEEFRVVSSKWLVEKEEFQILLQLENEKRSDTFEHLGPPVSSEHTERFINKWMGNAAEGPYIIGDRWVAMVERELVDADKVVQNELDRWAIGKDLSVMAENKKIDVYSGEAALNKAFPLLLTQLLKPKMPWEW